MVTRPMAPQTSLTPSVVSSSFPAAGRPRQRVSDDLVTAVARHLTDRDRYLCSLLAEHRVLTTSQLAAVAFDSPISARHRLATLYRLRVLDRFRPFRRVGTAPHHWVLDTVGAMVVAAERGDDPDAAGWRRDKALGLASSRQLDHRVGVNGFFCGLLSAARHDPDAELRVWWPERRCTATWGTVVRPDGYGVWATRGADIAFFLEYDRGTEALGRLVAKLDGYATLASATRDPFWILFAFPGPKREAAARAALTHPPVPTATAVDSLHPDQAIWLPLEAADRRLRLAELPSRQSSRAGRP